MFLKWSSYRLRSHLEGCDDCNLITDPSRTHVLVIGKKIYQSSSEKI